jgi:hypothetical protein
VIGYRLPNGGPLSIQIDCVHDDLLVMEPDGPHRNRGPRTVAPPCYLPLSPGTSLFVLWQGRLPDGQTTRIVS